MMAGHRLGKPARAHIGRSSTIVSGRVIAFSTVRLEAVAAARVAQCDAHHWQRVLHPSPRTVDQCDAHCQQPPRQLTAASPSHHSLQLQMVAPPGAQRTERSHLAQVHIDSAALGVVGRFTQRTCEGQRQHRAGWISAVLLETVPPPGPRAEDKDASRVSPSRLRSQAGQSSIQAGSWATSNLPCEQEAQTRNKKE